jgi:hypothetical protein
MKPMLLVEENIKHENETYIRQELARRPEMRFGC